MYTSKGSVALYLEKEFHQLQRSLKQKLHQLFRAFPPKTQNRAQSVASPEVSVDDTLIRRPIVKRKPLRKKIPVREFAILVFAVWLGVLTITSISAIHQSNESRTLLEEQLVLQEEALPPMVSSHDKRLSPTINIILHYGKRLESDIQSLRYQQLALMSYLASEKLQGESKQKRLQEYEDYRTKADNLDKSLKANEAHFKEALKQLQLSLNTP